MSQRKRHDLPPGCISSSAAARIAGTNLPRVLHWVSTGLLRPKCYAGERGAKNAAYAWRLPDVVAARTVAQLRARGLSLQRVRLAEAAVRAAGNDLAGVVLWTDGRDAFRVLAGKQLVSVVKQPGQHMVFELSVWAAEVNREVAAEVERINRSKAG
jgi:hypothetical protein